MKKLILVMLGLVLFFVGCDEKKNTSTKPVVAAILPLTGSASVWGKNAKNGIELAREHFDKDKQLKLIFFDSKSNAKDAVNALNKVISSKKKISVVIGDIASSSVLAMAPIANRHKVVLLSPGASNPDISKAGEYVFRNFQSDALEAVKDYDYVRKYGWKEVVTMYINNAYGKGLESVFVEKMKQDGLRPVARLAFEQDQKDFRVYIEKLKKMSYDIIYLAGYPVEMAILLKQMNELRYKPKILATQSFDDPQIKDIAGDVSNVVYSIPKPPDPSSDEVKKFVHGYKKKFRVNPGVTSDTGYDAFMIVYYIYNKYNFNAIDSDTIKEELKRMDIHGASGNYGFDKNGDVIKEFSFIGNFNAERLQIER